MRCSTRAVNLGNRLTKYRLTASGSPVDTILFLLYLFVSWYEFGDSREDTRKWNVVLWAERDKHQVCLSIWIWREFGNFWLTRSRVFEYFNILKFSKNLLNFEISSEFQYLKIPWILVFNDLKSLHESRRKRNSRAIVSARDSTFDGWNLAVRVRNIRCLSSFISGQSRLFHLFDPRV